MTKQSVNQLSEYKVLKVKSTWYISKQLFLLNYSKINFFIISKVRKTLWLLVRVSYKNILYKNTRPCNWLQSSRLSHSLKEYLSFFFFVVNVTIIIGWKKALFFWGMIPKRLRIDFRSSYKFTCCCCLLLGVMTSATFLLQPKLPIQLRFFLIKICGWFFLRVDVQLNFWSLKNFAFFKR